MRKKPPLRDSVRKSYKIRPLLLSWLSIILLLSSTRNSKENDSGYIVLKSLQEAYPNQIGELSFRNQQNDWSIKVNGHWFNWAHGRILNDFDAVNYQKYRNYSFYFYPYNLPSQPVFTPEKEQNFLKKLRRNGKKISIQESNSFRQALYSAPNKQAMNEQIQVIPFLKFRIKAHPMIIWSLKRVEQRLLLALHSNSELDLFLKKIRDISTYNWRKIRYFEKLSNHSFGTALDLIPYSWNGKIAYWNWERDSREDWFNTPYEERWAPPQILIDAFEAEGFIWGGKWLYFDPMHFEYRPELFLLRDYLAEHSLGK